MGEGAPWCTETTSKSSHFLLFLRFRNIDRGYYSLCAFRYRGCICRGSMEAIYSEHSSLHFDPLWLPQWLYYCKKSQVLQLDWPVALSNNFSCSSAYLRAWLAIGWDDPRLVGSQPQEIQSWRNALNFYRLVFLQRCNVLPWCLQGLHINSGYKICAYWKCR